MKNIVGLMALASGLAGAVHAQGTPDPLVVRSWAAACFNCHGPNGNAPAGAISLAGRSQAELLGKLLAYQRENQATVMHQLARGYSESQLQSIAAWFASQKGQP